MDKGRIRFLIIASSISIICLIALQLYWIKVSLKSQQEQFDQGVMTAMQEVIKKLEKEEAITKVTSQLLSEESFQNYEGDSLVSLGNFPLSSSLSKNPNEGEQSYASIQGDRFKLNIELPNPQRNDSTTFIMRETQKRVINSRIVPSVVGNDSLVKNQIKRKATLINEIVNELAFIRISNNFNERVDSSKIDSLFRLELLKKGIHTPFYFDILDGESGRLSFYENSRFSNEMKESEYSLQLFPNDYFIQSDTILLYFPNRSGVIWLNSWRILLISFLIVIILSLIFYGSFSTIIKQKKLSQIKNDFINNMTHELKTPISTISLACEALSDPAINIEEERRKQYVGMITNENSRLSLLVDNVLKSAVWDSSKLKIDLRTHEVHPIVKKVAESFKIQIDKKGGDLEMNLNAENDQAIIDEIHFTNVLYNLLDNANKYSKEKVHIKVESKVEGDNLVLSIQDNGIGISKEDQKKIFDKFYRVHTGNIHEVKGFGLGLSYVKRMVELFGGELKLKSKSGEGTTVIIYLKKQGTWKRT